MASDMIKLGGLWPNKDRNGKTFLTGKLSPTVKIVIFPNQYRESENHPTHIMYLSQVETQGQGQRDADQPDEFFDDAAFQRGQARASELGQARASQGGHMAPEDVPPLPEEEYSTVRRASEPMRGASSSQPRSQQARPAHRQPAPPPDYDQDDLEDPFADDAPAAAPTRQPQRPGTGRSAGF